MMLHLFLRLPLYLLLSLADELFSSKRKLRDSSWNTRKLAQICQKMKQSFTFFFFFVSYFNWRLIALQYCGGFCHILTWISHGWTCVPSSWTPSHLPPHPMPLGCPRALALSALLHALNLHWSFILHMIIYMFQCYSLKSSNPHLLSHSPKVRSLPLCLFCCFTLLSSF